MSTEANEALMMFVQESREHLDHFESDLLVLEGSKSDKELLNRLFRTVHSIKGGAGMFGLSSISTLSHTMESVMSLVREGELDPDQRVVDELLTGGDRLRAMVDDIENSEAIDIAENVRNLEALLPGSEPAAPAAAPEPATSAPCPPQTLSDRFAIDADQVRELYGRGRFVYAAEFRPGPDAREKGRSLSDCVEKLESVGDLIDATADVRDPAVLDECLDAGTPLVVLFSTVLEPDLTSIALEIPSEQICRVPGEQTAMPRPERAGEPGPESAEGTDLVTTGREARPPALQSPSGAGQLAVRKSQESIRVSVPLLNDLMNLAGEMVLGRNQLLRMVSEELAAETQGMPALLQNINRVTSELQEKLMRTRLQPIGIVFAKFFRIVRHMARTLGKELRLETEGDEVELDRSIIEALSDPLTHLVRNSADHGIEMPDEREAAGKPRMGTIQLSARHEAGQIHIEIVDDGRGMDPDRLKQSGIEKGLITAEQAQTMTARDAFALIFLPGFSTAGVVSDISGRGVGMDVVRSNIERLGGMVDLESQRGKGTRVALRLPLTLAIIPSLVVACAERLFAVPQANLEEIVRLGDGSRIEKVRERPVIRLRGRLLPVIGLGKLLGIQQAEPAGLPYILVLKCHRHRFGLLVDTVSGSEEIVVKPLSSFLKACRCYAGATILGDGRLAMILDAQGIAQRAEISVFDAHAAAFSAEGPAQRHRETQSLLLFRNGPSELFAMNLEMIARIEKTRTQDIERVGEREFLKYDGRPMRIVRLHDYLGVSAPDCTQDTFYVIIPKLVSNPMGIVATRVEDTLQAMVELDRDSLREPGILGSAVVENVLTVFLDVYGLFEKVDPNTYGCARRDTVLSGKRVLLAEDTDFFRVLESEYLKAFGCRVDVVPDGMAAWDRLKSESYDLVLTDLEMPRMDGFELIRRLRGSDRFKQLPIVALTALHAERVVTRVRDMGVDGHELKLDREHLRSTLERIVMTGREPAATVSEDEGPKAGHTEYTDGEHEMLSRKREADR